MTLRWKRGCWGLLLGGEVPVSSCWLLRWVEILHHHTLDYTPRIIACWGLSVSRHPPCTLVVFSEWPSGKEQRNRHVGFFGSGNGEENGNRFILGDPKP